MSRRMQYSNHPLIPQQLRITTPFRKIPGSKDLSISKIYINIVAIATTKKMESNKIKIEWQVIITIILAFGYGKQNDLEFDKNPHQYAPPPDTYNLPTFVETNQKHQKGFTPRQSR